MRSVTRRTFLLWSGWLAAGMYGCTAPKARPYPLRDDPFRLGVASGSPRHDSVVLWTRLITAEPLDHAVAVQWEMAEDAQFRRIVRRGTAAALPALGHAVHVEVFGLQPDRWYWYRFRAGEAGSPLGRTRTFPAPGELAERLRFAYASCQQWETGFYAAYRHMAAEALDCVLFLGDYIYESGRQDSVRRHNLPRPVTLAEFRQRYALYKSDPALQAMHAACPWLLTWDDHEVRDNYAGTESPGGEADFLALRTAAYQAWYEHLPLRSSVLLHGIEGLQRPDALRIYARYRFGRLAAFHVVDSRQYRDPPLCGSRPGTQTCAAQDHPQRSYLGAAQEAWLEAGLGQSAREGVRWNVLATSTVFNRRVGPEVAVSRDTWSGYRGAQERLLDAIQRHRVRNPIFVGGDIHFNLVANVHRDLDDPASAVLASEFVGTSISASGRPARVVEAMARGNPHWLFTDPLRRGYGVVELTPRQCEVTLRAVEDVRRPDSGIETLASFVVEEGRPGIAVMRRP